MFENKQILFLTSIYPSPDFEMLNSTSVCHFFTKEWVKMDYSVKVIYNYPRYFFIFHWIARFIEKRIANRVGAGFIARKRVKKDKKYIIEGVIINRFPLYKFMPKGKFSKKHIEKQIEKIEKNNLSDNFRPTAIIGHFHYPNLEIIHRLKKTYPNARTSLIIHGDTKNMETVYGDRVWTLIKSIDVWGYRSISIKNNFELNYGIQQHSFICYSGIPIESIQNIEKKLDTTTKKFIFVGSLLKQKHPTSILYALNRAFPNHDFSMTYIGSGQEEKKIKNTAKTLNIEENIILRGRLPREQAFEELKMADCFIMLSEKETFGLVYLEAMAKGCITIASRDEGMNGIIEHGVNGFFCKAGDDKELTDLINHINTLSLQEKTAISKKAIETAKNMTDHQVAKNYINSILK